MKRLICILTGATLLAACEQKTETVTPASSPAAAPESTTATTPATTTESPAAANQGGPFSAATPSP